jgi:hypothetical protein
MIWILVAITCLGILAFVFLKPKQKTQTAEEVHVEKIEKAQENKPGAQQVSFKKLK